MGGCELDDVTQVEKAFSSPVGEHRLHSILGLDSRAGWISKDQAGLEEQKVCARGFMKESIHQCIVVIS